MGAVTAVVAASTLKRNSSSDSRLLAAIPAIFAVHLFASALVWLGLSAKLPSDALRLATDLYLFVAFVLWPTYIPICLIPIERKLGRRIALSFLALIGIFVSLSYLQAIANGHGTANLEHLYVDFHVSNVPALTGVLYFLTTCGAALVSSNRKIFIWAIANLVIVLFLVSTENHGLPSLWCFWAAATSIWIWYLVPDYRNQN